MRNPVSSKSMFINEIESRHFLQITAICAIIAHDLMVRSDAISGDRSWLDTLKHV